MNNRSFRNIVPLLAISLVLGACKAGIGEQEPPPDSAVDERTGQEAYVPDQLIVRFHPDLDEAAISNLLNNLDASLLSRFQTEGLYLVGLPVDSSLTEWERRLEALPEVIDAQPNFRRRP